MNRNQTNRLAAYVVIVSACLVGSAGVLLFGAFLVAGPFIFIHIDVSEVNRLLLDGVLSILFFVQHSGMVRRSFRRRLSSLVEPLYHGVIYAMASGAALLVLVLAWQVSPTVLVVMPEGGRWLLGVLSLLAIAGTLWGVRALGAFDAFGLNPITARLGGQQPQSTSLVIRGPYLWVRHPLYSFMLVLIWSSPHLSADRLLFNVLWTSWIVLGSYLEERDLVAAFGDSYRQYQKTVPMLIPWRGRCLKPADSNCIL